MKLARGHTPDASAGSRETTVTQQIINGMSSDGPRGMGMSREHTPGHWVRNIPTDLTCALSTCLSSWISPLCCCFFTPGCTVFLDGHDGWSKRNHRIRKILDVFYHWVQVRNYAQSSDSSICLLTCAKSKIVLRQALSNQTRRLRHYLACCWDRGASIETLI